MRLAFKYRVLGIMAITMISCGARKNVTHSKSINSEVVIDQKLSTRLGVEVPVGANAQLVNEVAGWLGTPYKYGGNSKAGTDCSGLISGVFPVVYKLSPPRTTAALFEKVKPVSQSELQEGDLVFFKIETKKPGHSGIYLWQGRFVHASTSKGVIISNLAEAYWSKYYIGGGRLEP